MAKIGVIDVGGGLRGIYAAGVFDWCLENGVKFDYGIGISVNAPLRLQTLHFVLLCHCTCISSCAAKFTARWRAGISRFWWGSGGRGSRFCSEKMILRTALPKYEIFITII